MAPERFDLPLEGKEAWHAYAYHTLSSTQNEAAHLLDQGVQAPFAVITQQQTQGRGQWNRSWHSPEGHFYASFAFKADVWPQPLGHASLVGGLAVRHAILTWLELASPAEHPKPSVALKWPNDVLLDGRKTAGILCEVHDTHHLIMGIGVNLAPLEPGHPPEATSLCLYGPLCSPRQFLGFLAPCLSAKMAQWLEHGPAYINRQTFHWHVDS